MTYIRASFQEYPSAPPEPVAIVGFTDAKVVVVDTFARIRRVEYWELTVLEHEINAPLRETALEWKQEREAMAARNAAAKDASSADADATVVKK